MAVWRASGGSFERVALATLQALVGETLDGLAPGPAHRWDRGNSFRVRLASGALASASEEAVLNGANSAAIRTAEGDWHLLQFANAELVGERTYLLSGLLRGQLGNEWTMAETIAAGAPFVRLDAALVPLARGADMLGRAFTYRAGRSSDDVGSANMTAFEATVGPTALMPWSPAHLRGVRTEDGVSLSWVRRTRFGGDSWDALEVPLNEEIESYRVEILDGEDVARVIETSSPETLYANDDELADFGTPQATLHVRVAQLSAVAGKGRAHVATLTL
jgi:hypothetical protein